MDRSRDGAGAFPSRKFKTMHFVAWTMLSLDVTTPGTRCIGKRYGRGDDDSYAGSPRFYEEEIHHD